MPLLSTGVIERAVADNKLSPFPQVITTERLTNSVSNIVEGRVGLMIGVDPGRHHSTGHIRGIPSGSRGLFAKLHRQFDNQDDALPYVCHLIPARFYISVSSFHIEMLPTDLTLAITASKKACRFNIHRGIVYAAGNFEVLVEAGLRLPKNIRPGCFCRRSRGGRTGCCGCKAGFSGGSGHNRCYRHIRFYHAQPGFSNALRIWRFIFAVFSSIIGLYGLSIGAILLLIHLARMEVFGVPVPLAFRRREGKNMEDAVFRFPFASHNKRPLNLGTTNKKKEKSDMRYAKTIIALCCYDHIVRADGCKISFQERHQIKGH